jgi:PHD/YefM family antitoxin component YafN of YafNO toxin-antitoxin module
MKQISLTELRAKHKDVIAKFGDDTKLALTRYGKPIASLVLIGDSELQEIQAQELSTNVIK